MNLDPHAEQLNEKHHIIQQAIDQEEKRPHPDEMKIRKLKKEKLRIKEQLERYRNS